MRKIHLSVLLYNESPDKIKICKNRDRVVYNVKDLKRHSILKKKFLANTDGKRFDFACIQPPGNCFLNCLFYSFKEYIIILIARLTYVHRACSDKKCRLAVIRYFWTAYCMPFFSMRLSYTLYQYIRFHLQNIMHCQHSLQNSTLLNNDYK